MFSKIPFILFIALLFSAAVVAQSKDENEVSAAVESLRKAMIDGKKDALEKIAAEELSYGHSSGKVENKAEFVDAIATNKSDFVTIDLTEQSVKIAGNTAIVRHTFSATTNDNGNPGTVKLKILLVWQKQKGDWKLLARQAVRLTS